VYNLLALLPYQLQSVCSLTVHLVLVQVICRLLQFTSCLTSKLSAAVRQLICSLIHFFPGLPTCCSPCSSPLIPSPTAHPHRNHERVTVCTAHFASTYGNNDVYSDHKLLWHALDASLVIIPNLFFLTALQLARNYLYRQVSPICPHIYVFCIIPTHNTHRLIALLSEVPTDNSMIRLSPDGTLQQ
jgi:hypothetical protein